MLVCCDQNHLIYVASMYTEHKINLLSVTLEKISEPKVNVRMQEM
jgi:hypothetical protein